MNGCCASGFIEAFGMTIAMLQSVGIIGMMTAPRCIGFWVLGFEGLGFWGLGFRG